MKNSCIKIKNTKIGIGQRPFVIAELSGNHNQSLERAKQLVEAAAKSGAHAVKLQTYTADTMTIKGALKIEDPNSLWYGKELHDLYKEAYTPWEWHKDLFKLAQSLGMIAFSSPFDASSVDFLESLSVPLYKIASFENTDIPLLKKIAATKKPVIMSTGGATLQQVSEAVTTLKTNGCKDLVLLKCTSSYPASPKSTNLLAMQTLQKVFNVPVGLSDHTMGIGVPIASVGLGACVIEKHFTLKRSDGGVDSAFSIEPLELKQLIKEVDRAFLALGSANFGISSEEENNLVFKRSVYAINDIQPGDTFSTENLKVIRPGKGIEPKFFEMLLGKVSKKKIKKGEPITWEKIL